MTFEFHVRVDDEKRPSCEIKGCTRAGEYNVRVAWKVSNNSPEASLTLFVCFTHKDKIVEAFE